MSIDNPRQFSYGGGEKIKTPKKKRRKQQNPKFQRIKWLKAQGRAEFTHRRVEKYIDK